MLLDEKMLATLQKLGLTYYGARVYETLVLLGQSDATKLSAESEVPRTKIYDVLRRLETEGWITSERSRPITYTARYPKDVLEERKAAFDAEVDEISSELSMLYDRQMDTESPRVWLLRGADNVTAKVLDMIGRSKKDVMLLGALYFADEIEKIRTALADAGRRGLNVRLITRESIKLKDGDLDIRGQLSPVVSEVKISGPSYSKYVIVDGRELLIVLSRIEDGVPDAESTIAIWIPNTSFASYQASLFNAIWNE